MREMTSACAFHLRITCEPAEIPNTYCTIVPFWQSESNECEMQAKLELWGRIRGQTCILKYNKFLVSLSKRALQVMLLNISIPSHSI